MKLHALIITVELCVLFFLATFNFTPASPHDSINFNPESVRATIIENGKQWSKGLKNKDLELLSAIYDKDAHYLPDGEKALHGNSDITEYWKASMNYLIDIQLEVETLEGGKELLCETGKGTVVLLNQKGEPETIKYKYVNIWKLQKDGTYKVLIDTYNDIK